MTAKAFLRDQLRAVASAYKLHVVANSPNDEFIGAMQLDASFDAVCLERRISPPSDARAFWQLFQILRRGNFQIVHSVTPKAGLLAMAAGFFAGVPCRIHTFTGQVWATKTGLRRHLLRAADRLTAFFATHLLVDSPSQRRFLVTERVVTPEKSSVLGSGSISGVDSERFKPDQLKRVAVRNELGLGEDAVVFLYVGRLNRDKGIPELIQAFRSLNPKFPSSRLLIVGPDEENLDQLISKEPAVLRVGFTDEPERYMAAADVFLLPSHREGFGSTIIEAAACELPSIASRIYGLTDAVVEGQTGLLHSPGDAAELTSAMAELAEDGDKRVRMGQEARKRVLRDFRSEKITALTMEFYRCASASARRK
jgi:glycosyltransferase involved in cell wall biosynthesis